MPETLAEILIALAEEYTEFRVIVKPAKSNAEGAWTATIQIGQRRWTSHSDNAEQALRKAYQMVKGLSRV